MEKPKREPRFDSLKAVRKTSEQEALALLEESREEVREKAFLETYEALTLLISGDPVWGLDLSEDFFVITEEDEKIYHLAFKMVNICKKDANLSEKYSDIAAYADDIKDVLEAKARSVDKSLFPNDEMRTALIMKVQHIFARSVNKKFFPTRSEINREPVSVLQQEEAKEEQVSIEPISLPELSARDVLQEEKETIKAPISTEVREKLAKENRLVAPTARRETFDGADTHLQGLLEQYQRFTNLKESLSWRDPYKKIYEERLAVLEPEIIGYISQRTLFETHILSKYLLAQKREAGLFSSERKFYTRLQEFLEHGAQKRKHDIAHILLNREIRDSFRPGPHFAWAETLLGEYAKKEEELRATWNPWKASHLKKDIEEITQRLMTDDRMGSLLKTFFDQIAEQGKDYRFVDTLES
ncbi:MAG: hypothetical protein WC654_02210 [Patescibacteria group bacterium]